MRVNGSRISKMERVRSHTLMARLKKEHGKMARKLTDMKTHLRPYFWTEPSSKLIFGLIRLNLREDLIITLKYYC